MKIKINAKEFSKYLENLSKFVNSNNFFFPLRGFLIEVTEHHMKIIASDGNLSTIKTINTNNEILKIEEVGKILVPSTLFTNIIKKCNGMIEMNNKTNMLYIKSGQNTYEINLMVYSEYPPIDFTLYGVKLLINAKEFREAAKNVLFAASLGEADIIFSGVNINYGKNIMTLIATDSYRVAYQEIEVKDSRDLNFNVSLFAKNLKEFVPERVSGEVKIFVNEHKMNLIYDNTIVQSKLIDAPYKDVSKIFPENFSKTLTIEKRELVDAIDKAIVISSDSFHRLRLEIDQKEIKIISIKEEIGNSNVVINNKNFIGDNLIITVNYKYLKDALSVFSGEIQIKLNESIDRFVIIGRSNPKNKQLIAPQRSY